MIAAPIIGLVVACGDAPTTLPGVGGSSGTGGTTAGEGGTSAGGTAGTGVGGTGSNVGGSSGSGSAGSASGGSASGGSGSGGAGGSANIPELGYEPVGIGDPWFFSSEADVEAFTVEYEGASGSATWNAAGEMRVAADFTAAGSQAFIHFTAPWDAVQSANIPIDLSHRVLKARVRVASGATANAGVIAYSQSGNWSWVASDWHAVGDLAEFQDVEFDFDTATVPGSVVRFGLQVYANGAGTAELIIDDLRLEPKDDAPMGDAGAPYTPDAGAEEPTGDAGGYEPTLDAGAPHADGGGVGLGYTPVGIGDPWFFDTDLSAFEAGTGGGATASAAWSAGEVHVTASFAAAGDTALLHFTTPWNGTVNSADLSGRVIKASVRIASGATADGGVQVFAQGGGWSSFDTGGWNGFGQLGAASEVTLDLSSIANAGNIQRFGLQVYGTAAGSFELIVDDVRLEPAN